MGVLGSWVYGGSRFETTAQQLCGMAVVGVLSGLQIWWARVCRRRQGIRENDPSKSQPTKPAASLGIKFPELEFRSAAGKTSGNAKPSCTAPKLALQPRLYPPLKPA